MSVRNFVPQIWSRLLLESLKKNIVGRSLVNTNYEGDIRNQGDTVKIQTPSAINVEDYTGAEITFQNVESTTQSLLINIAKSFSFTIDDVDQLQANVDLMPPFMNEASFSLADAADQVIFGKVIDAHADNVITAALTKANVYANCVTAKKNLSLKNVPSMNRFIAFSPEEIALLETSSEFLAASDLGDSTKRTGFVGRIAGLEVFESNNILEVGNIRNNPYGYTGAITFADQLSQVKAGEHEKKHADYVKGLHVYGCKTIRPTGLGNLRNQLTS